MVSRLPGGTDSEVSIAGLTLYLELQSMMDAARPAGRLCAMRSHFMRELPDGVLSAIVEHFARSPSPLSVAIIEDWTPDGTVRAEQSRTLFFLDADY